MKTSQDIRHANLLLLLSECGDGRGQNARLAELTGVKPPVISQLRRQEKHSSGAPRLIGDEIARRLEKGMGKPEGWMDQDHTEAHTSQEATMLDVFRLLTDSQRERILGTAEEFAELNVTGGERRGTQIRPTSVDKRPKH